jgi:hypothetical protein
MFTCLRERRNKFTFIVTIQRVNASARTVGWVELVKPSFIVPDIFVVANTCCVGFRKLYPTYYSAHFFIIPAKPAEMENCEHAE